MKRMLLVVLLSFAAVQANAQSTPSGKQRFTFVPNADYERELVAKADPNEVPEPACGEWGDQPDGIQYFEVSTHTSARKVLFVRIGHDVPLFDEQTLQLIEPKAK